MLIWCLDTVAGLGALPCAELLAHRMLCRNDPQLLSEAYGHNRALAQWICAWWQVGVTAVPSPGIRGPSSGHTPRY